MPADAPEVKYLKDYKPSDYLIPEVALWFELGDGDAHVRSRLTVKRREGAPKTPLVLDGEQLRLLDIAIDGESLMLSEYQVDDEKLTITDVPESFVLDIEVEINPYANKALSGLYVSHGNFCTQCESHGFRRITYFLDRPDVLSTYSVTITADRTDYPALLSNGNCIDMGTLPANRHWAKWEDPFPKPCYLFALVGGDFDALEDRFVTQSGREVTLKLYVEKGKLDQAPFAMASLKKAMAWDEQTYHREYDLDIYMIVAVSDFNFGAMENKGLNIFNSRYILANTATATDFDFANVLIVVGHEYFHNWSGNRVTCRDWFQLSLKEGLTVLREQHFTEDMTSEAVSRIQQAKLIQTAQFSEDAGPMAHPIRPASYIEMNNFYTMTVYNKGAEVIRMIESLLGRKTFAKALDAYFERFDGQAVTTDDFVDVMQEVGKVDLSQFRIWYNQAGTPMVQLRTEYLEDKAQFVVHAKQVLPHFSGQKTHEWMHIPLAFDLFKKTGGRMRYRMPEEAVKTEYGDCLLSLQQEEQSWVFEGVKEKPVLSMLRRFTAPVAIEHDLVRSELLALMRHDTDAFVRWQVTHSVILSLLKPLADCKCEDQFPQLPDAFVNAYRDVLTSEDLDPALIAEILSIPTERYLLECMPGVDIDRLHAMVKYLHVQLAHQCYDDFKAVYLRVQPEVPYHFNAEDYGKRSLRSFCLSMMMHAGEEEAVRYCTQLFDAADNMTDTMAVIKALLHHDIPERDRVLGAFYDKWHDDALVVDKWFSAQAMMQSKDALAHIKKLCSHNAFDYHNPNCVRALIGQFVQNNLVAFHNLDGSGYQFLVDQVKKIQQYNPQLAARLLSPMIYWRRFDEARQALMRSQLERLNKSSLAPDIYELVTKALSEESTPS